MMATLATSSAAPTHTASELTTDRSRLMCSVRAAVPPRRTGTPPRGVDYGPSRSRAIPTRRQTDGLGPSRGPPSGGPGTHSGVAASGEAAGSAYPSNATSTRVCLSISDARTLRNRGSTAVPGECCTRCGRTRRIALSRAERVGFAPIRGTESGPRFETVASAKPSPTACTAAMSDPIPRSQGGPNAGFP